MDRQYVFYNCSFAKTYSCSPNDPGVAFLCHTFYSAEVWPVNRHGRVSSTKKFLRTCNWIRRNPSHSIDPVDDRWETNLSNFSKLSARSALIQIQVEQLHKLADWKWPSQAPIGHFQCKNEHLLRMEFFAAAIVGTQQYDTSITNLVLYITLTNALPTHTCLDLWYWAITLHKRNIFSYWA